MTTKKLVGRGCLGFLVGTFINTMITIIISYVLGDGSYYAVVPQLAQTMGNEINAVVLQFVLGGLLGAAYVVSMFIWEVESWSRLKQTVIHFCILLPCYLVVAYFAEWIPRTVMAVLGCAVFFAVIYLVIWFIQYFSWKKRIAKINAKIEEK